MEVKEEHLLALKVMRLSRPTLYCNPVVSCDGRDLAGPAMALLPDVTRLPDLPHLQVGEMLLLPQSFGSIYLGETFSCYLSVYNGGAETAGAVTLRAELQTGAQRITLTLGPGGVEKPVSLPAGDNKDIIIHHEVKDIGAHILVCAINYTNEAGVSKFFRKFFKFEVLKPLDVKTKFYNSRPDEVHLEAQIQNITPGVMFMDRVTLDPSASFSVTDLNEFGVESGEGASAATRRLLGPQDSRQYLFRLAARPDVAAEPRLLRAATAVGKLDISWRGNLGQKGRLQTSQLQRMAPALGDVQLSVDAAPGVVAVDRQFHVQCSVRNTGERALQLWLRLEDGDDDVTGPVGGAGDPDGLVWRGVSDCHVADLQPGGSTPLRLELEARTTGLQSVPALTLVDKQLNSRYEFSDLAQVLVVAGE